MPSKGSRYQNTRSFSAENGQLPVFEGIRSRTIGQATGVLEYTVKENDRLDLLALYFYVDSRKWWRILDANPDIIFGADLTLSEYVGETIMIPRAMEPGAGR
jgi:nucleoid-associated protein YgaU